MTLSHADPLSPAFPHVSAMASRKRKADDDTDDNEIVMSTSPSASPAAPVRPVTRPSPKRMRTSATGRTLALPRLLETLDAKELRGVLQTMCERHPGLSSEVASIAPRPDAASTLKVLSEYESAFQAAFPFGCRPSSDYSFNRVRPVFMTLLDALKDFTMPFLPPNEVQLATSLEYLNNVTEMIHRLPNWDTFQHNRHKQDAYEEMAKAWTAVIHEGMKRAGGIQLQCGDWDVKLAQHNGASGGRMQEALTALRQALGWIGGDRLANGHCGNEYSSPTPEMVSVREQLLSGTYGISTPTSAGRW